jgi:hypothetical protein
MLSHVTPALWCLHGESMQLPQYLEADIEHYAKAICATLAPEDTPQQPQRAPLRPPCLHSCQTLTRTMTRLRRRARRRAPRRLARLRPSARTEAPGTPAAIAAERLQDEPQQFVDQLFNAHWLVRSSMLEHSLQRLPGIMHGAVLHNLCKQSGTIAIDPTRLRQCAALVGAARRADCLKGVVFHDKSWSSVRNDDPNSHVDALSAALVRAPALHFVSITCTFPEGQQEQAARARAARGARARAAGPDARAVQGADKRVTSSGERARQ